MSYFATIAGADVSTVHVPGVVFTAASGAQSYIQGLESVIASLDGSPVYLCDDGASGTSHDFVCTAEDFVREHATLAGSPLEPLLTLCERLNATLRIWWASNDPNPHLDCVDCTDRGELLRTLLSQPLVPGWLVRYHVPRSAA